MKHWARIVWEVIALFYKFIILLCMSTLALCIFWLIAPVYIVALIANLSGVSEETYIQMTLLIPFACCGIAACVVSLHATCYEAQFAIRQCRARVMA